MSRGMLMTASTAEELMNERQLDSRRMQAHWSERLLVILVGLVLLSACSALRSVPAAEPDPGQLDCSQILEMNHRGDVARALGPACALATAGNVEAAQSALDRSQEKDSALPPPRGWDGLLRQAGRKPSDDRFEKVRVLKDAGFLDEAARELERVKDQNRGLPTPDDLAELSSNRRSWLSSIANWDRFLSRVKAVGAVVGFVLLALAVYVLVVRLFLSRIVLSSMQKWARLRSAVRWIRGIPHRLNQEHPVLVQDFSPSPVQHDEAPGAPPETPPTVPPVGRHVAELVRDALHNLSFESDTREIRFVESATSFDVGTKLQPMGPQGTLLGSALDLWQRLVAPARYVATGMLQPAGPLGVGLTVTLQRTGEGLRSTTLWEATYDPSFTREEHPEPGDTPESNDGSQPSTVHPSRYLRLAPPAAAWVYYQLLHDDPHRHSGPFGTREWESYALFQAGLAWHGEGNDRCATLLFMRALTKDPDNLGARLNFVLADSLEAADNPLYVDRALKNVDHTKTLIENRAKELRKNRKERKKHFAKRIARLEDDVCSHRWDANWYRASYHLVVLYAHKYEKMVQDPEYGKALAGADGHSIDAIRRDTFKKAWGEARRLVVLISTTLCDVARAEWHMQRRIPKQELCDRAKALRNLLEELWPAATIALAYLAYVSERGKNASRLRPHKDKELTNVRICTGVVCVFPRASCPVCPSCGADRARLDVIDSLRTGNYPKIGSAQIATCAGHPEERLLRRGRYNLACYLAQRGEGRDLPAALGHLRYGLADGTSSLAEVRNDPTLRWLRSNSELAREFWALAWQFCRDGADGRPQGSGLADQLPVIGRTPADALAKAGISNIGDLLRRAATPENRQKLADETRINVALLERWARLAELVRAIESGSPEEILDARTVQLLDSAQLGSVASWSGKDVAELQRELRQAAGCRISESKLPTRETLERWRDKVGFGPHWLG